MEKVVRMQIFVCQTLGGCIHTGLLLHKHHCQFQPWSADLLALNFKVDLVILNTFMLCAQDCWCDIGFVEATSAWPSLQCAVVRVSDNNDTRTLDRARIELPATCSRCFIVSMPWTATDFIVFPIFRYAKALGTCPTAKDENALAANTATKAVQATWQRGTKHFQGCL